MINTQPLILGIGTIIIAGIGYMIYRSTQQNQTNRISIPSTSNSNSNSNKNLPRGVRNNNPLNIRDSSNNWKGLSGLNRDKAFEEFSSPEYGFRAGARILRSYYKQGYTTLSQMIHRWAPAIENNTRHYVELVSQWTGISASADVNVNDDTELSKLLLAMSRMEVGSYYDLDTASRGVAMA